MDQRDVNEAREEKQDRKLAEDTKKLEMQRARTLLTLERNVAADNTIAKVLKGIDELVKLAHCFIRKITMYIQYSKFLKKRLTM